MQNHFELNALFILLALPFFLWLQSVQEKGPNMRHSVSGKRSFKIALGIFHFIALNVNAHWEFINTEK